MQNLISFQTVSVILLYSEKSTPRQSGPQGQEMMLAATVSMDFLKEDAAHLSQKQVCYANNVKTFVTAQLACNVQGHIQFLVI